MNGLACICLSSSHYRRIAPIKYLIDTPGGLSICHIDKPGGPADAQGRVGAVRGDFRKKDGLAAGFFSDHFEKLLRKNLLCAPGALSSPYLEVACFDWHNFESGLVAQFSEPDGLENFNSLGGEAFGGVGG